ncbi:carbon monoxide dehydrogenase, small subunit, partial [mine drainage metagenome]
MVASSRVVRVNGAPRTVHSPPGRPLLAVLREELDLTGTKYGCGEGECGACTVLVDGLPVRACQVRVGEVGDRAITTVEGLARDGRLSPVQRAFLERGPFQCGFCTPGMLVAVTALLKARPSPSRAEAAEALEGNLCRCGGLRPDPRGGRAGRRADPRGGGCAVMREGFRPARPWDRTPVGERAYFDLL